MYTLAHLMTLPYDGNFTLATNIAWGYAKLVWMDERNSIADRAQAVRHVEEQIMGMDRNPHDG